MSYRDQPTTDNSAYSRHRFHGPKAAETLALCNSRLLDEVGHWLSLYGMHVCERVVVSVWSILQAREAKSTQSR
jgi:hypothetical protein